MGTLSSPDRFIVFQTDIIQRACIYAFSASDAAVCCIKCVGFYIETIESLIDWTTFQVIKEVSFFAPSGAFNEQG